MPYRYNFKWDTQKAAINANKHGVTFEQAATLFRDALAITIYDEEHSESEERWVTMGESRSGNLLVVIHTFEEVSEQEALIRIISARQASKSEQRQYEAGQ